VLLQAETEPDELNEENEVEATAPPSSLYPELDSNPDDDDIPDPEMEEEPLLPAAASQPPPAAAAVTPPPGQGSPAAASTPRLHPSAPSRSPDDRKSDDTASAKSTEL